MRKKSLREKNLVLIAETLFKRTYMGYTLLFHAEDIAEETLSEVIYVNGVPIFSTDYSKPEYARNRRRMLRYLKRRSEIKPYRIVWRGKNVKLRVNG